VLVDDEDEADVLWLTTHYKNFAELAVETPHKFINFQSNFFGFV